MHQLGGYDFVASDPEIRDSLEFRITDHDDHVVGEHWDTERDGPLEDFQLTNGRYGEITIPDCSGTVTLSMPYETDVVLNDGLPLKMEKRRL